MLVLFVRDEELGRVLLIAVTLLAPTRIFLPALLLIMGFLGGFRAGDFY